MLVQNHVDDISRMSEEELGKSYHQCISEMSTLRKNSASVKLLKYAEEEFCYLYREAEIRESRRRAHDKWLRAKERHAPTKRYKSPHRPQTEYRSRSKAD